MSSFFGQTAIKEKNTLLRKGGIQWKSIIEDNKSISLQSKCTEDAINCSNRVAFSTDFFFEMLKDIINKKPYYYLVFDKYAANNNY